MRCQLGPFLRQSGWKDGSVTWARAHPRAARVHPCYPRAPACYPRAFRRIRDLIEEDARARCARRRCLWLGWRERTSLPSRPPATRCVSGTRLPAYPPTYPTYPLTRPPSSDEAPSWRSSPKVHGSVPAGRHIRPAAAPARTAAAAAGTSRGGAAGGCAGTTHAQHNTQHTSIPCVCGDPAQNAYNNARRMRRCAQITHSTCVRACPLARRRRVAHAWPDGVRRQGGGGGAAAGDAGASGGGCAPSPHPPLRTRGCEAWRCTCCARPPTHLAYPPRLLIHRCWCCPAARLRR